MTCARACSRILTAAALAAGFVLGPSCGGGGNGVGGILVALFTPTQPSPGADTVSMQAGTSTNDTFQVKIMATDVQDFFGAAFHVTLPASVTLMSSDTGGTASFLNDPPATASDVFFRVDAASNPGEILVTATRKQNATGTMTGVDVVGTRELLSLTFRVTQVIGAPGQALSFANPREVRDSSQPPPGALIPVTWAGGTVTATRQ